MTSCEAGRLLALALRRINATIVKLRVAIYKAPDTASAVPLVEALRAALRDRREIRWAAAAHNLQHAEGDAKIVNESQGPDDVKPA